MERWINNQKRNDKGLNRQEQQWRQRAGAVNVTTEGGSGWHSVMAAVEVGEMSID